MKKIYFLFLFVLIPLKMIIGNPIALPQAFISELTFDENNNWILEVKFQPNNLYLKQDYDSICIGTTSGYSRIKLDNIRDSTSLFVITSDSLAAPLQINRDGDYIKLYSYINSEYYKDQLTDSLAFGDFPGSIIDFLQDGYSIAIVPYGGISKDKSPTIGFENDTVGTCGTLRGYIYDKNNKLVTNGNFMLDNWINFENDGSFITNVYSRRKEFAYLWNYYQEHTSQPVKIDSIKLNVNPDSLYENDIHLLSDYIVGIEEKPNEYENDISIENFPNPFNSSTIFFISVPAELQSIKKKIDIFNATGERIYSIRVRNNQKVRWEGKGSNNNPLSSGIYYYQLIIGDKVYKNGKMILLK